MTKESRELTPEQQAARRVAGVRVITVSDDGQGIVWDATTGETLATLKGHTGPVRCVSIIGSGERVVTASDDGTARIWDVASGQELHKLMGHTHSGHSHAVLGCAAFPPGAFDWPSNLVVTVGADALGYIWEVDSGKQLVSLKGHERAVERCVVFPEGSRVLTVSFDNTGTIWDADPRKSASQRKNVKLQGHQDWITCADVFHHGKKVLTGSQDCTACIWDSSPQAAGKLLKRLQGHTASVTGVCVLNSRKVLSVSADKTGRVWFVDTGEVCQILEGHSRAVLTCTCFRGGSKVVTAGEDQTARIWNAGSGKELEKLDGHKHFVVGCAVLPDNVRILTVSTGGSGRVWDPDYERKRALREIKVPAPYRPPPVDVKASLLAVGFSESEATEGAKYASSLDNFQLEAAVEWLMSDSQPAGEPAEAVGTEGKTEVLAEASEGKIAGDVVAFWAGATEATAEAPVEGFHNLDLTGTSLNLTASSLDLTATSLDLTAEAPEAAPGDQREAEAQAATEEAANAAPEAAPAPS